MSWKRMRRRSPRVEKGWKILWINCSRPWTVCRRTWGQWLIDWSLWRFRQCKRKSQSSDRRCRRRAIWPLWLLLPLWICHQEFCHHLRHHLWHLPWHRHSPCPDFKAVQDAIWLVDRFRSSSTRLQTLRCSMILKMIPTRNGIYADHKWVQLYPNEYERNPPIRADDSYRFDHVSWVFFNNFMSDILQFGGLNLPLGLVKHLWAGSIWFLLHDLNICIWTSNSKMSFSHWLVDY